MVEDSNGNPVVTEDVANEGNMTNSPGDSGERSEVNQAEGVSSENQRKCCSWARYQGVVKAQGYTFAAVSHGSIFMSNIFLSTSFIYLASEEAGCLDDNGNVIVEDCDSRVYGFYPSTFVTNIAAIAGLLAAFFMPWIGAIIDYTPRRRTVGKYIAFIIFLIQAIQIGTVSSTWFPMAILQAIVGALFEVHYLLAVSYLPDIPRYDVDHDTMTLFNRNIFGFQFGSQVCFLLTVLIINTGLGLSDVATAQVSQILSCLILMVGFTNAWRRFPEMEGRHSLPEDHKNLFVEGFRQNWNTFLKIYRHSQALRWFFLFVCVVEAGTTGLMPVSIAYLSRVLGFDSRDVGITFLLTLTCSVLGSATGCAVSRRWNPCTSLKIDMSAAAVVTFVGAFIIRPDTVVLGYLWGALWGFFIGWFYATEQLFYTFCLPPGQEAEFAGFFVYCTIILAWLPPLIFSIIIESGAPDEWSIALIGFFQILGVLCLFMIPSWDVVLEGTKNKLEDLYPDDHQEQDNPKEEEQLETQVETQVEISGENQKSHEE